MTVASANTGAQAARAEFLARLPWQGDPGTVPDRIGSAGFDVPGVDGLVAVRMGSPGFPNLTVTSEHESNVVLVPAGFSPTVHLRIHFTPLARDNVVVLGNGANPFGEFKFHGSRSIAIFAGEDRGPCAINLAMSGTGSAFFWGRRSSSNGLSAFVQGDQQSAVLGEDCMVAQRASVMTSDLHAVLDLATGNWLNPGASIVIEPHVWLGWESMVMKGVTLGFGAAIAARSVVTRDVPAFAISGGTPNKTLRSNALWTRPSVPVASSVKEVRALAARTGQAMEDFAPSEPKPAG